MVGLTLSNVNDTLDLDAVFNTGAGVQVLRGVTGLGLASRETQWFEGAGHGSTYRGMRVKARDIDLRLYVVGLDREDLKGYLRRLVLMLSGPCLLSFVEGNGEEWSTEVNLVAGGDFAYGIDTIGETELQFGITLRAGDPFFTSNLVTRKVVSNEGATPSGLLIQGLANMRVAPSQAIGDLLLENPGDAPAYPVWMVRGGGSNFEARLPDGTGFHWTGTLVDGETLVIDTKTGRVYDSLGRNRYHEMAPAPRLWAIPPGLTQVRATLQDVSLTAKIEVEFYARKWMVV